MNKGRGFMRGIALIFGLTGMLSACADDGNSTQMIAFQGDLSKLEARVSQIEAERAVADDKSSAYLEPASDGYAELRTDFGTFTVQITNIVPYANGSRVTLKWGNPTSATISELKAKVQWGEKKNGSPDYANAHEKEIEVGRELRPGTWTSASLDLADVPPTALGFVVIRQGSVEKINLYS